MNNKPVAWMNEYEQICHATDKKMEEITNNIGSPRNYFNYTIPLYTHPADLTDEEINQVWNFGEDWLNIWTDGTFSSIHYVDFARAILRKASEK